MKDHLRLLSEHGVLYPAECRRGDLAQTMRLTHPLGNPGTVQSLYSDGCKRKGARALDLLPATQRQMLELPFQHHHDPVEGIRLTNYVADSPRFRALLHRLLALR